MGKAKVKHGLGTLSLIDPFQKLPLSRPLFIFDFRFSICDCRSCAANRSRHFEDCRDIDSERAYFGATMCELSGGFCRREYLFHGCGLLRADDASAALRRASRINCPSSRFRKFSQRHKPAYDRAARLFNSGIVESVEAVRCLGAPTASPARTGRAPPSRSGWRIHFAIAGVGRRLVSLVVVAANAISLSLGIADSLRD